MKYLMLLLEDSMESGTTESACPPGSGTVSVLKIWPEASYPIKVRLVSTIDRSPTRRRVERSSLGRERQFE